VSTYSHAGGVVVRTIGGQREYLIVEAARSPGVWVLPKGHVEPGETQEAAAIREVEEESGVRAVIVAPAGESEYAVNGKHVLTIFFLMRYEGDTMAHEQRAVAWRSYEDALRLLQFDNLRRVLTQAHALTTNDIRG
jgi:8-oxo-dGTP pyrophosphatase MutT (NUDIX family)